MQHPLQTITGSRARAGILTELLKGASQWRRLSDLARASGVRHSAVQRELRRLTKAGLIRASDDRHGGSLRYAAHPSFPGLTELRLFVEITAGRPGRIREALLEVDRDQLAWIHGRHPWGTGGLRQMRLVAITKKKRTVMERLKALERELVCSFTTDVMGIDEWVTRLQKREIRARALRRACRIWLIGDEALLRQREGHVIGSRRTLEHALANWREELSDDWDEDWDPSAHGHR